jgi:glycosyltransferase involved in cell wall biosynthesis
MNIWYIHPYGGGPGIGRFFRPYDMGKIWMKMGHSTTVLLADYHHLLDKKDLLPPRQNIDGVEYVALRAGYYKSNGLDRIKNMARFCLSLWSLRKRVGKDLKKPDVIIASSPHPFVVYPAYWLAKRLGAKLVFEIRDIWPLVITEMNGTSKWHPFVIMCGFAERFAYRKADVITTLMAGAHKHIAEIGIKAKHVVWIPHSFSIEAPPPPKQIGDKAREILKIVAQWHSEGRKVMIYPGAMGPPNALDLLLEAMRIHNTKGNAENVGVILVGGGPMEDEHRKYIAEHKLENVHIFSTVPKDEAEFIVSHCDIGYAGGKDHAAVYRFGFSRNKIMDFIKCGLPIIVPHKSDQNPVDEWNAGTFVKSGLPEDIAVAIQELVARLKSGKKPDVKNDAALYKFTHEAVAQAYIDAINL